MCILSSLTLLSLKINLLNKRTKRIFSDIIVVWNVIKLKSISKMQKINRVILKNIKVLEMSGVIMRIFSFSLVSWFGSRSPFLFVWIFNTLDAIILSWCSVLRKDKAYSLLNIFWIIVGVIGVLRASGLL